MYECRRLTTPSSWISFKKKSAGSMSTTPVSALVPAGARHTREPSFAQQGTVDWVALGQTQFSASIAILGRLSSAGIEPLTVAVRQAMCCKIPLGAHGEKVLSEAMASLKACSSFGDVIWFGVGVRHILRVLVQTAQGAFFVALCAALSESHSLSTSALVLYEMSNKSGSLKGAHALIRPMGSHCESLC